MAKPNSIELPGGVQVPILYEDRSVLGIDKPAGWMLSPIQWNKTGRNLQRALMLCIQAGDFWARSRNIKYIRFVHRLDAETSGALLLARSPGALSVLSELFESRRVRKRYLAVVAGIPKETQWVCRLKIALEPDEKGRMQVDAARGRDAETEFRVLQQARGRALVEALPLTGRTHQIRVHLAACGCPVAGDRLYGTGGGDLGLRSVEIAYTDPFQKRPVRVTAPREEFLRRFQFGA